MEWFFGLFALCFVGAFVDDVHEKWHQRQMAQPRHYKETIYA